MGILIQCCLGASLLQRIFPTTCYEVRGGSLPKVTEILGCELKLTNVHGFPPTILFEWLALFLSLANMDRRALHTTCPHKHLDAHRDVLDISQLRASALQVSSCSTERFWQEY